METVILSEREGGRGLVLAPKANAKFQIHTTIGQHKTAVYEYTKRTTQSSNDYDLGTVSPLELH